MENHLYGRLTTLNALKAVRDNPNKHKFHRQQADKNIIKIMNQLKDPQLMRMRERLLRASKALDSREAAKITQIMRDYEKQDREVE